MNGDSIIITPRNVIYVRYLLDNRAIIADLAKEHYGRPIQVEIGTMAPSLEPQEESRRDAGRHPERSRCRAQFRFIR
jgi:hypothetical protein